jgi:histidine triad (HIT) family protein
MGEQECMACRTAAGDFAAEEVYRDDRVVAVVAQHAINPGHLVVVPVDHVRNALTMDEDLTAYLMIVATRLAKRMRAVLGCPGVMLVLNNEAPCQTLFHAHLHVIPRYHGDEMDRTFGGLVPPEDRAAVAERFRATNADAEEQGGTNGP